MVWQLLQGQPGQSQGLQLWSTTLQCNCAVQVWNARATCRHQEDVSPGQQSAATWTDLELVLNTAREEAVTSNLLDMHHPLLIQRAHGQQL